MKGSLLRLEELKAEHRERFRAAAPKVKQIDVMCFRLRCPTALNPNRLKGTWRGLRLAKGTCTRRTCPREVLEIYLRVLNDTRTWRQEGDSFSRRFWRDIALYWQNKLRKLLGIPPKPVGDYG